MTGAMRRGVGQPASPRTPGGSGEPDLATTEAVDAGEGVRHWRQHATNYPCRDPSDLRLSIVAAVV